MQSLEAPPPWRGGGELLNHFFSENVPRFRRGHRRLACSILAGASQRGACKTRTIVNALTWKTLEQKFAKFPITVASEVPTASEIADAAAAIGCSFHDDYVAFLKRFGGAMVGSLPVFGLRPADVMGNQWSVVKETNRFRNQAWPGIALWYIISEDGFGNPIGIAPDGRVMISDHDVGQVNVVAENFEEFLLQRYLKQK
jgi:hypothetical protein